MKRLRRYLLREGARERARPSLFEALLAGRGAAYAAYRLRFLMLRTLLRTLLHTLELYFLSLALPWDLLSPLLSYRAVTALLASGYWGALEGLRSGVREQVRARRHHQARQLVEAWLGLSMLLALACLVVEWAIIRWAPSHLEGEGFNLFDAYGSACFLRLAIDLVARTYHSGIFALRRVYRPLSSFVLPDVVELFAVIVAWRQLGPWGLPLSIVLVGAWRGALSFRYAARAYGRSRMGLPQFARALSRARTLTFRDLKAALVHAAANASSQIDALLLLVLSQAPAQDGISMAVLVYGFRPVLASAHSWTRAFYFDFKQLESGRTPFLIPHLLRFLRRVSTAVALLAFVMVAGLSLAFLPGEAVVRALWLLPLFAGRSLFSLEQLRLFTSGAYADLSRVTLLLALGLGVFAWSGAQDNAVVTAAALVLLLATLWTRQLRSPAPAPAPRGQRVQLSEWLSRVQRIAEPCVVVFGRARREVAGPSRVLDALAEPNALGTRLGDRHFLWALPGDLTFPRTKVLSRTAGALRSLVWIRGSSGADTLSQLIERRVLPSELSTRLVQPGSQVRELGARFVSEFPSGTLLDLRLGRGRLKGDLDRELLRAVLAAIEQGERVRGRSPFDVAVYAPHGAPETVYVVPRGSPGFAELRREVELCACRDALSPTGGKTPQSLR